ncbi:MAG TPA: vWA domain-containing protein [Vicinamibacterales bacterium]|jgi:hypothetical protein|nr:vWA domain-containing protein [Vicinamibacterales bacterium]
MHPSNIVRLGALCAGLVAVGCGFSPGKPVSGTGGTGNIHISTGGGGIGNFGGTTSGQGGLTGQGGNMACGAVPKSSAKLPPDILIVLDASGSMNDDATNTSCGNMGCGATSKWALMTPAINQVVTDTQAEVNWGLKFFADSGSCGVNNNAAVPVAVNNSAAIGTAIMGRTSANGGVSNGSSTPTRSAENAAVTYLNGLAQTDQNPKFIVLATDGLPNCPASGNMNNDDSTGAVAAVTAAKTAGYPTFVVGIATAGGTAETTLNSMAAAGGYPQMGAATQFYAVTDTAGFANVLRTLVGVATTCQYSIPPPPTNDGTTSREDIKVTGGSGTNDPEIPQDANNGWTYTDNTHTSVTLHGSSCDAVMAGTITTVTIIFNCHII